MNHYQINREHFNALVDQATRAVDAGAFADAAEHLSVASTFAWENYAGMFLDRRVEALLLRIAQHVNATFATEPRCTADVGFLMTSIHTYGGHSKIAWRWMQLDREQRFQLVLIAQHGQKMPEQLTELVDAGRVTAVPLPSEIDVLQRIREARDQLAGASTLVMNIHPNDVVGAIAAACLRESVRIIYFDHAFFSFSLGMPNAHALCCTSPAAVAIATQERLISPEHLVWYRNSPEWLGQDIPNDGQVIRERLGIPGDAPLLLSSGTEHKFYPVRGVGLLDLISPVLDQHPEAHLVIIGIRRPDRFQSALFTRHARRLHLIPPVSERELLHYVAACDIYLDSIPNHSGGTAQQAMLLSKPTLGYADPQTYRAHLAPQFFSVDDFSWIHFSKRSYQTDLEALIRRQTLRQERGSYLQAQVSSRISEQDNLDSIHASYRKARHSPLIIQTLLAEASHVENPALHLVHGEIALELSKYRDPDHGTLKSKTAAAVRAIAFYLPQFHEIPENSTWWGQGFTEWTNVRQGKPLFEGHNQPVEPTELGYYDLTSTAVLAQQAKLAQEHGIFGFCFYYYWFDGKRLLEKPVDQLLSAPHIDLPFCLCWANENWTKRWDGGDQEVLMHQSYSPSLHDSFAGDLTPYFLDPRYIRIEGKPVLLVYRTDIIPDLIKTVAAWRTAWRDLGVGEVYLIAVESFQPINPDQHGFDACAEFPPHQIDFRYVAPDHAVNLIADPDAKVGDYNKLSKTWLDRPTPDYKRFRGLLPAWDNSARRRKGGATLLINSTPAAYENWLSQTVSRTLQEFDGEERLVFINAWNEWGEGCTLEPDARWGRAYLEATQNVMRRSESDLLQEHCPTEAQEILSGGLWSKASRFTPEHPLFSRLNTADGASHITVAIASCGADEELDKTMASLKSQFRAPDCIKVISTKAPADTSPPPSPNSWTVLLREGDVLENDALLLLERSALQNTDGKTLIIYFDHDEIDAKGHLFAPNLKPEFNLDLLLSYPYMGRAIAVRTSWAKPFLEQANGLFDLGCVYRVMLRALGDAGSAGFVHVPAVLAHLTTNEPTTFAQTSEAWQDLAQVLQAHLETAAPGAKALEGPGPGTFHVIYPLPRTPLVSIIIPTRDQLPFLSRCIDSLLSNTDYPAFEILVVDNDSQTPEAREFLAGLSAMGMEQIRVLSVPGTFNFSRMNNLAAAQARGEFILMLNNDTAALHPDWLSHMIRHALRQDVGIVGAQLLYPDGKLQHAGVIMGLRGPAEHPCLGLDSTEPGYLFRAQVTQNFSAVTAACLLVSKSVYEEVGGLDEATFGVSYNDIDFCLRVGQTGRSVVWTPLARLLHEGSASQKADVENKSQAHKVQRFAKEQEAMYLRWPEVIANDPAYNPNLSLDTSGYELETNTILTFDKFRGLTKHRIAAFAADAEGCGHYRILRPMQAMREAGFCTGGAMLGALAPNLVLRSGADTLILQRPSTEAQLDNLRALAPLKGIRKIYEVDDNLAQVPIKSAHYEQMPKDLRGKILKGIGLCHRLVVSTEPLAKALASYNDDVRVVPNRLSPAMWGATPPVRKERAGRETGRKPRVVWAGGVGHRGDLEMIADVVKELADKVDWIFFGMCPERLRPYVREFYAGVPTLDYPQRLMAQDWDLAIAPLESNPFNDCKSNLKLLEYGWCGIPVVCSDVTPYQGDLPCTRVKNRHLDWRNAIIDMTSDLAACRQKGLDLQKHVADSWMLNGDNLQQWYHAWTD
jgi:O-antigen biosynthesis protein